MAERKKHEAPKADALYQWIAYDLKRMKSEILQELNYSAMQLASLYNQLKSDDGETSSAITQEIRYGYRQNQSIFETLSDSLVAVQEKVGALENLQSLVSEVEALKENYQQLYGLYEELSSLGLQTAPQEIKDELSEDEYKRISEIVKDNVLVHSRQVLAAVAAIPVAENVDYTRIVDEVGDRLLEILTELKALEVEVKKPAPVEVETKIDYDRIIGGTVEKVVESFPYTEKIDYARISASADKAVATALASIDVDGLASAVAEKVVVPAAPEIDYERLSDLVVEKLSAKAKQTYDVLLDDEGLDAIATKVAEKLCAQCVCSNAEEPISATEDASAEDELAVSVVPAVEEPIAPIGTELVERVKKSFTAKMKQSEDDVKKYYSALKNALISYRKINSNVSWNGDRFNFGRDTVAKITIVGKTLCFYLALDPSAEEFKQTEYRQKDVGAQKKHESTPFMVKVKSDLGTKKAVRLIEALAQKLGTEKADGFAPVDFVAEYGYETDEELEAAGHIKRTQEKKVAFDF